MPCTKAKNRASRRIINGILNKNINDKQRVIALRTASTHPQVWHIFKSAGLIDIQEFETIKYIADQMNKKNVEAQKTEKK